MECRSCTDALTALMDQELPPAEQQSVEEHLSTCASCRNEYESLLEAHRLPVQLSSISPDVGLWRRIEAELAGGSALGVRPVVPVPSRHGLGNALAGWLLRPWVPISALGGILIVMLAVNYLDPPDPIEHEFSHFIQQRERIYDNQRKLLSTDGQWQPRDARNPFSQPVSFSDKNPFQE